MQFTELPDTSLWDGVLALSDLGIIVAHGADTPTFLHGQLSQDMAQHPSDQTRLAAYCSPKGRMLASLQTLRPAPDTYWLLLDKSVLPATLKRLSMFVMRSKAKLEDAAGVLSAVGLVGASAERLGASDRAIGHAWPLEEGWMSRLPDVHGVKRCLWVGPVAQVAKLLDERPSLPAEHWAWLNVMSGVPQIQSPVVDQFVPQMVNYELVGGVNFSKGCYPGQEVVARSQYRGTLKRRAFVVHGSEVMASGQEVFSQDDPGQPAGMVINAAAMPGRAANSALVELKLNALDSVLHLGSAEGPTLQLGKLPYDLPSPDQAA